MQLPPLDTVITYPAILMLTLYVIELIHPRWANWRRTLLLLSPWGLLTILLFVWQGDQIRTLHTCREVFHYLYEPNVWIRFPLDAHTFTLRHLALNHALQLAHWWC